MALSSNRARNVAAILLAVGIMFFVVTFMLGKWSGFAAVGFISFYFFSTALVSFVLLLQFALRALAEQEKLDTARLGDAHSGAIFAEQGKQPEQFEAAQKRLGILEKWFVPALSALIAIYQAGIGILLFYSVQGPAAENIRTKQPLLCAVLLIVIAFISFLLSRYATGMSTEPRYKPLRAAGSNMLGAAVLCFLVAVCLALVQFQFPLPLKIISYIIPGLLILLGIETALNVILDIYRPRIKDQYSRSAFDSRLLGIISEPGEVLHTVAGAIDYQFGFKVSQTWFYQLLERAIVPLILMGGLVLYMLSTMVVVEPQEQVIIERFGNPLTAQGDKRLYGPGLIWKMPWPIDIAYKYPTEEVREIYIGYQPKLNPKTKLPEVEQQLIWGKTHYQEEYDLVIASPTSGPGEGVVPVSIVKANVPVQYKIKDLYDYMYNHSEPEKLLEAVCYGQLADFAASAKVEVDSPQDLQMSILGAGRERAKQLLTERIQAKADEQGLGIEIVFVGLQGVHPPVDVAEDYQKVVAAVQEKEAAVLNAQTVLNRTLGSLAGSVGYAEQLYKLAIELENTPADSPKRQQLTENLDEAFAIAGGDIFKTLAEAKSYAFEKATLSEADSKRFEDQMKPYLAATDIYKKNLRLEVFEDESLANLRKYIFVAEPNDSKVFIVDMQEKLTPGLYDITGLETNEQ